MSEHSRPLAATPSEVARRVTQEQLEALREARDNLTDCLKAARRNTEEIDDLIAKIATQVTNGGTE